MKTRIVQRGVMLTCIALVLSAASPLGAAAVYAVKDLGLLTGSTAESRPNAINQSGKVVAANQVGGLYRALVYGGAWTNLGTLGGSDSYGAGINDSNLVVGYSFTTNGVHHPFLWTPGGSNGVATNPQMRDLGTLGGTPDEAEAFSINRTGQITGYAVTPSGGFHAFLYSAGTMTDVGTLLSGLPYSYGYGINNSGHIAGTAYDMQNTEYAFFYNGTTAVDIGSLGRAGASALALNNNDQVVGYATTASKAVHAFRYAGGVMVDLGTLGGNGSYAVGINNSNVIVGGSYFDSASVTAHAFVFSNSIMADLNTQMDASGAGWTLNEARVINDAGLIAGFGVFAGANHAFLLNPLPQITQQPLSLVLPCKTNANFTVAASPSPLSYQWYKSAVPQDLLLLGATNTTLTISNVTGAQGGNYYAVVTRFYASVTSSVVSLTIVDTTPPVFSGCPANLTNFTAPGLCSAVVTWTNPTAIDSCDGSVPVTVTPPSGTSFNTGVTTVTCRANDSSGNTNTCTFTVTVLDHEPPVLSGCPANITNYTVGGLPKAVTWTQPTANDNCQGIVPVSSIPTNGSTFSNGVTIVTCTARDASGNTNTCTFTVTLLDAQAPLITGVNVIGQDVLVRFTTQTASQYALESSSNIGSNAWTNSLSGIVGTGKEVTVTNSGAAKLPLRFYRVKLLPP